MTSRGPLPWLVGGTLVVAVLATVLVKGGAWLWMPVLLALAVLASVWHALRK